MKPALLFIGILLTATVSWSQMPLIDSAKIQDHPRLLLLKGEEERIKTEIRNNAIWKNVHDAILKECDSILKKYPVERTMIGRRLLQVSREGLRRIFFLSYAWRTTGKKKYFNRCEEEMLAVCNFSNWNPDHFLDVAEMTMAVAIGYDWLYHDLSEKSKNVIRKAIIEKGINPSLEKKYNGWLRGTNNWNQVCNAGISFGALAVYEDQPQVTMELLRRAVTSIVKPMNEYAPAGNYKEGYSYWGYGTSFNVFFNSALEKIFGTAFGLNEQPGFMESASFYQHLISQEGAPFNYSDAGSLEGLQPAMFWFADKLNDPTLLFVEKTYLLESKFNARTNRLLPAAMIWGKGIATEKINEPAQKTWAGKGDNQVVMMRTSWKKNQGIYVGFKGGSPSVSHAHMDAGSFVMDAGASRWSADLGMQQYNSLESAGLSIWDMSQGSQRWDVFRYSNFSHSTLTVNGHLQQVKGNAPLVSFSDDSMNTRAVLDLTNIYKQDLANARRGIAIINKQYVTVRDELESGDSTCIIRWTMLTPAKIVAIDGHQAQLESKGQKLFISVAGLPGVKLQTWRTDPPHSYDAVNPGTTLIGFEMSLPARTKISFNVILVPGEGIAIKRSDLKELDQW
ncbi:heparinase II/III domain-containing protein [Pseudobacter ginsenosidimutans]|nr:heparinase II/III family protein [Pseudobacter ginsenosidimutans]QEC41511.1 heparinase [Pseudobacter ginsenosidimutans]